MENQLMREFVMDRVISASHLESAISWSLQECRNAGATPTQKDHRHPDFHTFNQPITDIRSTAAKALANGTPIKTVENQLFTSLYAERERFPSLKQGMNAIGSLQLGGEVSICDPCYLSRKNTADVYVLNVAPGTWDVQVIAGIKRRQSPPLQTDILSMQLACQGRTATTWEHVGMAVEDSTQVGVFSSDTGRHTIKEEKSLWYEIIREKTQGWEMTDVSHGQAVMSTVNGGAQIWAGRDTSGEIVAIRLDASHTSD